MTEHELDDLERGVGIEGPTAPFAEEVLALVAEVRWLRLELRRAYDDRQALIESLRSLRQRIRDFSRETAPDGL